MASTSTPPPAGAAAPGLPNPAAPVTPTVGELQHQPLSAITEKQQPRARARSIFAFADPVTKPLAQAISSLQESRQRLGLPNPGTVEGLTVPVRSCHASNLFFDGGRADLSKTIAFNPIFQITHSFTHGAQGAPPGYQFGTIYGSNRTFMQAGIDDAASITMRLNRRWAPGHISKVQGQFPGATTGGSAFVQLEHDFQGLDHSINLKAMNPNPTDLTGIYQFNFLQSLTRNFALGLDGTLMRQSVDMPEANMGYVAKWTSDARDAVGTLQVQPQGVAQATYWQRVAERVEAAVDLQAIAAGGRREAAATVGAKWDFRMSTFRASIDSGGKVTSLLETRLSPALAFTFGGEIDHVKNAGRFGVGIAIESMGDHLPQATDPNAQPPATPSPPM